MHSSHRQISTLKATGVGAPEAVGGKQPAQLGLTQASELSCGSDTASDLL